MNIDGRLMGQKNEPISIISSERHVFTNVPENVEFNCIYSSDLLRAKQTLNFFSQSFNYVGPVIETALLRERCYGDWEGMQKSDIPMSSTLPPNGESSSNFSSRILTILKSIEKTNSGAVIVFSHSGVYRQIMGPNAQIKNGECIDVTEAVHSKLRD